MRSLNWGAISVKSLFATFSFDAGRDLAVQLEHLAGGGPAEGAAALTAEVIAAIEALAVALGK